MGRDRLSLRKRLLVIPTVATCLVLVAGCSSSTAKNGAGPTAPAATETVLAQTAAPSGAPNPQPSAPLAATPAAATAAANGLTGTWSGTWKRDLVGGGGAFSLVLQDQAGTLTGTVDMQGSVCLTKPGPLKGAFSGSTIAFTVTGDQLEVDFLGTLSAGSLSGTLRSQCSLGTGTGSWQVARH